MLHFQADATELSAAERGFRISVDFSRNSESNILCYLPNRQISNDRQN